MSILSSLFKPSMTSFAADLPKVSNLIMGCQVPPTGCPLDVNDQNSSNAKTITSVLIGAREDLVMRAMFAKANLTAYGLTARTAWNLPIQVASAMEAKPDPMLTWGNNYLRDVMVSIIASSNVPELKIKLLGAIAKSKTVPNDWIQAFAGAINRGLEVLPDQVLKNPMNQTLSTNDQITARQAVSKAFKETLGAMSELVGERTQPQFPSVPGNTSTVPGNTGIVPPDFSVPSPVLTTPMKPIYGYAFLAGSLLLMTALFAFSYRKKSGS
jgi:hypothetical protein